ncbi:alpha/beta fold hydrolase [Flavobacterium cerinum]|uniref:Alpha/beta hydrolase n=1 Tax=Flavobacterium cerinum TaxID=2502784 RepID=A0A444HB76_9FLAO|nr:alpha/beta hydrolase [Flavobacterium cerinum]RWX00563.1 alpha/beta hydrolase [Flavobacterium cerinum]
MQILKHKTGKSISINAASIYYEELGNPSGFPILMLHGGFGTLEDFEPIISNFLSEFRIIAMDARGQGKSTLGGQPLTYKMMQDDAERLLDHLKISKIILIGFSDGGMVAHRIAISDSERVSKLVSIAAPWRKEDLDLIRGFLLKVTPESWEEKFKESYQLYESLNPSIDFKILVDNLKHMWLDESETGGYPGNNVKQINCPALIVRGDEDHLFSRESAVALASFLKNGKLLNIPFGGHEVHKDQSKIVSDLILTFIKE